MTDTERIGINRNDITNLKDWQKTQNGSIQRIEAKVDRMLWALYLTLFGLLMNLFIT